MTALSLSLQNIVKKAAESDEGFGGVKGMQGVHTWS
jgi:hypothetical protein